MGNMISLVNHPHGLHKKLLTLILKAGESKIIIKSIPLAFNMMRTFGNSRIVFASKRDLGRIWFVEVSWASKPKI